MTIYVVIPVYNRLAQTQRLISCLRSQRLNEKLHILVVDDGSNDNTADWLAAQNDVEVLTGSGSLFWGGAVDLALKHLMHLATPDDWVMLMNNDTTVEADFVQQLLNFANLNAPAAIGSVVRDEADKSRLLSMGASLDAWRLVTHDLVDSNWAQKVQGMIEVDALSGRGVLLPIGSILASGGMRPRMLPHYMADYELSLRVKKCGWRLLVAPDVAVYSEDDFGSARRTFSWWEKYFSVRSPFYAPALLAFWWEASNWFQRLTLPVRLPFIILFPRFRAIK